MKDSLPPDWPSVKYEKGREWCIDEIIFRNKTLLNRLRTQTKALAIRLAWNELCLERSLRHKAVPCVNDKLALAVLLLVWAKPARRLATTNGSARFVSCRECESLRTISTAHGRANQTGIFNGVGEANVRSHDLQPAPLVLRLFQRNDRQHCAFHLLDRRLLIANVLHKKNRLAPPPWNTPTDRNARMTLLPRP